MNYERVYDALISRAKNRPVLDGYVEYHHILPRSMGGDDSDENMVALTAREHFIAHLLLERIYGGSMTMALYMMSTRKGYTNRKYETLRLRFAKLVSENKERNLKISKSLTGKKHTDEHIQNWKESRLRNAGWVCSEEKKANLRITMKGSGNPMFGKTHSLDAIKKIKEANFQKVECHHCGKIGGIAIMKRWHFDRCKNK